MAKRLDFRFSIPRPPEGSVVELSADEAERILLKDLNQAQGDKTQALWQLAQFYRVDEIKGGFRVSHCFCPLYCSIITTI